MDRPVKKAREPIYHFSECMKYLEEKYGFEDARDYAGKHTGHPPAGSLPKRPHLDFWHWVHDKQSPIFNGGTLWFLQEQLDELRLAEEREDKDLPDQYKGWRSRILGLILEEFAEDPRQGVKFLNEW